jgi:cold-inducible RNA-binding protein
MRVLVEGLKMNNKLFVGNLAYSVTDATLQEMFVPYGQVISCNIATDRDTGRSRGFGFVEMQSPADAENAITGLNGRQVGGRQIAVSVSQPKPQRTRTY